MSKLIPSLSTYLRFGLVRLLKFRSEHWELNGVKHNYTKLYWFSHFFVEISFFRERSFYFTMRKCGVFECRYTHFKLRPPFNRYKGLPFSLNTEFHWSLGDFVFRCTVIPLVLYLLVYFSVFIFYYNRRWGYFSFKWKWDNKPGY